MKILCVALLSFCTLNCNHPNPTIRQKQLPNKPVQAPLQSYDELKESIAVKRKGFYIKCPSVKSLAEKQNRIAVTDFWVNSISKDLYDKWQHTPWDFNGTAVRPNEGPVACGFFVTAILQDMDCKINRHKLSVCAASEMMNYLTPNQAIKRLNSLSYADFNDSIKRMGKGVYIIGLDFHIGFIVNDGSENWFIHSNYIERKGVTKEPVLQSAALQSSATRWIISLTGDEEFLYRWLRG